MPFFGKSKDSSSRPSEEEEEAMVSELRASLNGLHLSRRAKHFLTDACLRCYLRCTGWSLKKSLHMLKETIKWRNEYKPEDIKWADVAKEAASGELYIADFLDKEGRGVLVVRPGAQRTHDVDCGVRLLVYTLENAITSLSSGQQQVGMLVDMRGWSILSTPVSVARAAGHILQAHYPDRVAYSIYYNPPKVFETFCNIIKPFFSSRFQRSALFVSSRDRESDKLMGSLFDMDELGSDFGGRSGGRFDVGEYAKVMELKDAKRTRQESTSDQEGLEEGRS